MSTRKLGRNFIVAFTENYGFPVQLALQLSSYDEPSIVQITILLPNYNQTVPLAKNSTREVILNTDYMLREGEQSKKLIMVTSDTDISVVAFNTASNTADALSCLPKQDLGTEYYIYTPATGLTNQFAVGNGEEEQTEVNVTVSGSLVFRGVAYNNKQTFSFTLGQQEIIQFNSPSDLTGTRVTSSTPVAVFSGNKCYTSPIGACDTLVVQLYPVKSWGKTFVAFPLINKDTKDSIDIISASSNTTVYVVHNGRFTEYNLEAGSHVSLDLENATLVVNSTKPIMISYLFQGGNSLLGFTVDPFLTTVPPNNFSSRYYKFVTKDNYYNYLFIVSHSFLSSEFLLDGTPLSQYPVTAHHLGGFTGWQVELGKTGGQHEIMHQSETFGIYIYGIEAYISYGYSLGQASSFSDPEEPELICLAHGAEYRFPLSLVTDADLSIQDVHLNNPECQAQEEGRWAVITVPFDKCGSQVLTEDGETVYVNTVYGSVPNTTIHRIEIPLKCEMVDNETLGFQFHPTVVDKVAVGHHNLSLQFYKSDTFKDPITMFPYEINLHGNLYVEFKVESDDQNLQIHTENCNSSPSLAPGETSYSLVKHGCPEDTTLHAYPSGTQKVQRFGFHVFKFEESSEVYLLCDVIICHNDSFPNRCTQGCSDRRHKRDLSSSGSHPQSARLSQGPFIFKLGEQLKLDGNLQQQNLSTNLFFIGTLCGIGLLASVALIFQRRYYRRQSQGYMILKSRDE